MRLINCSTLQLEEYAANIPRYAVLSHRWLDIEISFHDFLDLSAGCEREGLSTNHRAFFKVRKTCEAALTYGQSHVWIDTCCIDKTNSSELSEAINSMFKWYKRAELCLIYLYDVEELGQLQSSSWFTRGWTLQELLAPSKRVFLNSEWKELGVIDGSTDKDLSHMVSAITRIPRSAMMHEYHNRPQYSVAQIMSWAAGRVTTKEEDMAYCLMGLFAVHMPLIYGEGIQAFQRLQQHIMEQSADDSLFAFGERNRLSNFLALTPDDFRDCASVFLVAERLYPYKLTNVGLEIMVRLLPGQDDTKTVVLNCTGRHGRRIGFHIRVNEFEGWDLTQGTIGDQRRGAFELSEEESAMVAETDVTKLYLATYAIVPKFLVRSDGAEWDGPWCFHVDICPLGLRGFVQEEVFSTDMLPHMQMPGARSRSRCARFVSHFFTGEECLATIFYHEKTKGRVLLAFGIHNRYAWIDLRQCDEYGTKADLRDEVYRYLHQHLEPDGSCGTARCLCHIPRTQRRSATIDLASGLQVHVRLEKGESEYFAANKASDHTLEPWTFTITPEVSRQPETAQADVWCETPLHATIIGDTAQSNGEQLVIQDVPGGICDETINGEDCSASLVVPSAECCIYGPPD